MRPRGEKAGGYGSLVSSRRCGESNRLRQESDCIKGHRRLEKKKSMKAGNVHISGDKGDGRPALGVGGEESIRFSLRENRRPEAQRICAEKRREVT